MTNYVKTTDYAVKDSLTTGDPLKIIKGTEINTEFNNIQQAVATKANLSSPNFLGNPTAVTQPFGDNSTRLATTAFLASALATGGSNVTITGGTIQGVTISNLANAIGVASGGTGRVAIPVGNVVLGNGTSPVQEVAPGASGNVLVSNGTTWQSSTPALVPSLGVGQTWQNVTGSRVVGTTYTNTTGKPIFVSVYIEGFNSDLPVLQLAVDGLRISHFDSGTGMGALTVSGIVPNNSTYVVTRPLGANLGTLVWAELR